jgi:glycerophosphoryl diester phosphodiesterase
MAWPFPRIFAHRGGGVLAPENTMAGLAAGVAHGHNAVEFDVMLSADDVPVLMHDASFGRTVAGRGNIALLPASALVKLDAGAWFDAAFEGETIPTLADALAYCRAQGVFMNIEIKPAPGRDKRTGEVVAAAARDFLKTLAGGRGGILLSSFSAVALGAARAVAPDVPRGYLLHRLKAGWGARLHELECVALHCNHELVDAPLMEAARSREVGVFCYTVNSLKRARELKAFGVDALCTDRIDLIRSDFFAERNS